MIRLTTKLSVVALGMALLAGPPISNACPPSGGGGYRVSRVYHPPTYQKPYCPPKVVQAPPPPPEQFGQVPSQGQFAGQGQVPQTGSQGPAPQQGGLGALGGTQSQAPAAANNTAEMTALQALAGMGEDQPQAQPAQSQTGQPAQPAAPQVSGGRVGAWVASLPNNATVRLDLRADGSFVWTASNNGKTSNFSGSYSLSGESLTLIRSGDNQQLAGTLTDSSNGFNFKLNGAKDSGLNFARA